MCCISHFLFSHFLWISYSVWWYFLGLVSIETRSNPVMFLLADFEGNVIKDLLFRPSSESSLQCVKHLSLYFCDILSPLIVGGWILDRAGQRSKNIPWIIIRMYEQMHFHWVTGYPAPSQKHAHLRKTKTDWIRSPTPLWQQPKPALLQKEP